MKIQCSCGAKYEFDIAPEMARNPVQFVCAACGLDASEYVSNLVRKELAQAAPAGASPAQPAAPSQAPPPQPRPAMRVRTQSPEAAKPDEAPAAAVGTQLCSKHPSEFTTDKCYICSKPICPKCMELFGYVCSPLCKAKAQSHGVNLPVYEGQKSVVEARFWRKVRLASTAMGVVVAALVGVWIWFEWFGSEPKPVFSVRFPEPAYSGQSAFAGKDQIVFLHGDTLARYDLAAKKEIWSRRLVDREEIAAEAADELKQMQSWALKSQQEGREDWFKPPPLDKLTRNLERAAAASLELRVQGQNIWVTSPGKLARYDWESGKPVKEIALRTNLVALIPHADEFVLVELCAGQPVLTHVDLNTCESRAEGLGGGKPPEPAAAGKADGEIVRLESGSASRGQRGPELAGLPMGMPGRDGGKPMDPAKVAAQAQHLSYPARIALPATLAVNMNQERALAELNDSGQRQPPEPAGPQPAGDLSLIPTRNGFVEFFVKLLESRIVERGAMKAAPAKSVLDGPVSMATSVDAANEVLNEMQRSRGGDVVQEDVSRYQVTLRQPGTQNGWTGEVIGPPALLPLQTVNVLAANKRIVVFDKTSKNLWESTLNYNVPGGPGALDEQNSPYGLGPCVERQGSLYVFDQGVLTAFDLATGNARWRFPSVGIVGLFFDAQGMIYVNTTTAGPESLKYSRQIDISQKTSAVVLKLEPKTGKVLWRAELGGLVNYVSGKFIYTVASYMPPEKDDDLSQVDTGFETPPYLRIKRINPRNGSVMWEHFQQRAPWDVQFDQNSIRLVFKKEVQVLRFLSF